MEYEQINAPNPDIRSSDMDATQEHLFGGIDDAMKDDLVRENLAAWERREKSSFVLQLPQPIAGVIHTPLGPPVRVGDPAPFSTQAPHWAPPTHHEAQNVAAGAPGTPLSTGLSGREGGHEKPQGNEEWYCDYPHCESRLTPIHRKDTFIRHFRQKHKEGIPRRGEVVTLAYLNKLYISTDYWRCSKCAKRVPTREMRQDKTAWKCTQDGCRGTCGEMLMLTASKGAKVSPLKDTMPKECRKNARVRPAPQPQLLTPSTSLPFELRDDPLNLASAH